MLQAAACHAQRVTRHMPKLRALTHYTSRITWQVSRVARRSSFVACRSSHVPRHTSHVTRNVLTSHNDIENHIQNQYGDTTPTSTTVTLMMTMPAATRLTKMSRTLMTATTSTAGRMAERNPFVCNSPLSHTCVLSLQISQNSQLTISILSELCVFAFVFARPWRHPCDPRGRAVSHSVWQSLSRFEDWCLPVCSTGGAQSEQNSQRGLQRDDRFEDEEMQEAEHHAFNEPEVVLWTAWENDFASLSHLSLREHEDVTTCF